MTIDEALKLLLNELSKIIDKDFNVDRIDAAYITTKTKKIVKLNSEDLKKYIKK